MASHRNQIAWRCPTLLRTLYLAIAVVSGLSMAQAQEGAPGLTKQTLFLPFDPNAPACTPPPDLRRVLTFVQENEREFLRGVDHGLSPAAKDRSRTTLALPPSLALIRRSPRRLGPSPSRIGEH